MPETGPKVFFNEYNPFVGRSAYLPLVAGKLHSLCLTDDEIAGHYHWMQYQFRIRRADDILADYDQPAVAAFSAAIWNEQLCLHVAREVKRRWPECLIVFGGSQVPHEPAEFLRRHDFIDVTVRGEGEEPFLEIMRRFMRSRDFSQIERVGWRGADGAIIVNADNRAFQRDLDMYPSPFLEGLYDELIRSHPEIQFQAIIETNRGCPFLCTFCYWGKGGLSRKYRYFGVERVYEELEWIARNRIAFVYNADSNFGMHRRDEDIATRLVEIRRQYGYPEKIVNLYGKNTDERIFRIARLLHENGLHKGIGLSRQSLDPRALKKTKRANISLEVYESLQRQFEAHGIPVFSELIIALPGETYESFAEGINVMLETSFHSQLIIVLCEIYPNTEMGDPDYQAEHGIVGRRNISHGVHSKIHEDGLVPEYIDYIVQTDTMPVADWKRTGILSWTTMTLVGLRIAADLIEYLTHRHGVRPIDFLRFLAEGAFAGERFPIWSAELAAFDGFMEQILAGRGRGVTEAEFGDIYWAVEEASFLRLADRADRFFPELLELTRAFLHDRRVAFDARELADAITYQRMRVPTPRLPATTTVCLEHSIPEYLADLAINPDTAALSRRDQLMIARPEDFGGDKVRFAREKLLWGRRGGKLSVEFTWHDSATQPGPPPTPTFSGPTLSMVDGRGRAAVSG